MAISASHMFGPYFFEDSVNQVSYRNMLQQYLLPDLQLYYVGLQEIWFMQDGEPARRANATLALLETNFGDRIIFLRAEVE
jgi:hypothetical protein